jgi:GAF domain-containing protein
MERLLSLSEFDIDYSDHYEYLQRPCQTSRKSDGYEDFPCKPDRFAYPMDISNYGLELEQMLREDSVCQYTIMETDHFEIDDLSLDDRFKDKFYVTGDPNVRYYYGIPLKTSRDVNIGALCVLDQEQKSLDPEKIELMKIIADEIVAQA